MLLRFQQRGPVRRRSGVTLATLALVAFAPATLRAQGDAPAPGLDPLCRCVVGGDSGAVGDRDRDRTWALLGAAGLALLAGVPIGSAGTPAIPFVEGPAPSSAAPLGTLAPALPSSPGAPPGVLAPPTVRAGEVVPPTPAAPGSARPLAALPAPRLGIVPPKTATHLPLLAAAGVLLMGGGGLLARRQARQARRRRRRIMAL